MQLSLDALGWDPAWDAVRSTLAYPDSAPARVAVQHRGGYILYSPDGETVGAVSGRLRHEARNAADFPAVGDWVLAREGVIQAVLPRRSAFARKAVLDALEPQIAAANVDVVFVVEALDAEPNLRRIERYLTVAYESGARPVVLLSKSDLCPDVPGAVATTSEIAPGTPVHALSARTGAGLDVFERYCDPGRTTVFLGPSGVGKTTLLNALSGDDRPTAEVLADGRGRHTTTHRELVLVEGRGLVIDTPGMRELQLWDAGGGLAAVFADIDRLAAGCRFDDCAHANEPGCAVFADVDRLAAGCRFADCAHANEPGCAVRAAIAAGTLAADRYASYRKLEREEAFVTKKRDVRARAEEKRQRKIFARSQRRRGWRGQD